MLQVSEQLEEQVLHRRLKQRAHDIFSATQDINLHKKRQEVETKLNGLDMAYDVFARFNLVSK